MKNEEVNNQEYFELVNDIKNQIKLSGVKTTILVNTEMILMYHRIGKMILERSIENLEMKLREKEKIN